MKIIPSDPFSNQRFGSSVAIYEDTYVIGAEMYWTVGQGAVYVYHRDGGTLSLETVLLPDTTQPFLEFGYSVAVEDSFLVVGAPSSTIEQGMDGIVFVYVHTGETWMQQSMLYPSYPSPARFGLAIALSTPYLIISDAAGTAIFYKYSDGYWAEDTVIYGKGAVDVAIDGGYAVLGSPNDDALEYRAGAAYVYHREDGRWMEADQLIASDGGDNDGFGVSVALAGEHILIGAHYADGQYSSSGAAYIFQRQQDQWLEKAKLSVDDAGFNDCFGSSVDIDGHHALIGAYRVDATGLSSGSAYYFRFIGSQWMRLQKFTPSNSVQDAAFGCYRAVAIDSNACLVGAYSERTNQIYYSGAAYLFTNKPVAGFGVKDTTMISLSFILSQNYPNPFNPVTTLRYELPQASEVLLLVYDLLGREVARLVDGYLEPGYHEVQWNGREFTSGIYITRLTTPEYSKSIKMVLLK